MNTVERLVYMANQIGRNLAAMEHGQTVAMTADHIDQFWDPYMKAKIFAHLSAGGAGLDPAPLAALTRLALAEPVPGAG